MENTYTIEDLEIDEQWLRGLGCETEEIKYFLIQTITAGFKMTRAEYVNFINEATK